MEKKEMRQRRYVAVVARIDESGKLRPLEIELDEKHYPIDRILDVRRAACQSAGGTGDRYTCRIRGQVTYLWHEENRWFVAEIIKQPTQ